MNLLENQFKSFVSDIKTRILEGQFVGMKGFSQRNLWNMRSFYIEYKENQKLQTLSAQIGWSHNVMIFQKCKDKLERE